MNRSKQSEYSGNLLIDSLMIGSQWAENALTFSFPDSSEPYLPDYPADSQFLVNVQGFSEEYRTKAVYWLNHISDITGLKFTLQENGSGDLRFARFDDPQNLAYAYYPGSGAGGDMWFANNGNIPELPGDVIYHITLHEIGHALGLKHPFEGPLVMPAEFDIGVYTAMSYSLAPDGSQVFSPNFGSWEQTLPLLDMAALQHLYGANFSHNDSDTRYTFDESTGEVFVNGVSQGLVAGGYIFRTIWDGGGRDQYDLSNFSQNQKIDLKPGGWSTFSQDQLQQQYGKLNDVGGIDWTLKPGNIVNALLYQGDERSLIEDVISGSGDDQIFGNAANNLLAGNGGSDILVGWAGNDTLQGGDGDDDLTGGEGDDVLSGGNGIDTASFLGISDQYSISISGKEIFVESIDIVPDGGKDSVIGVEFISFSDVVLKAENLLIGNIPVFTSNPTAEIFENDNYVYAASTFDPNGETVKFSLSGNDASLFQIDALSGAVSFRSPPNFENPADADNDNRYDIVIRATNESRLGSDFAVSIKVADKNEMPTITSGAIASVVENQTLAYFAAGYDPDAQAAITYSIAGTDAGLFNVDGTTGVVRFKTEPDFEAPDDADGDNEYQISVNASDGALSDSKAVTIKVTNLDEVPVITSNGGGDTAAIVVPEGQSQVTQVFAKGPSPGAVTYTITGGADASRFAINPVTGQLSFVTAPDFEQPDDSDGDNLYDVIVSASDGSLTDIQTLNVSVADRSVAPRLITPDGFAGGIGGTTAVFLTSGFQDLRIIDGPGTITLSGPPGGDDIIRFAGAASAYTIARVGSRVEIADGDTVVSIPVSPTGINVVFGDGPRTLAIVAGQIRLGSQLANNTPAAITIPADTDPLPNLADPAVRGRLIVAEGLEVTVAGKIDVFGTSFDNELFVAAGGDIAIRGGFTGGMDTVGFNGPASDYTAVRSGSAVFIETSGTRVSIPVSPGGTRLTFADGERLLRIDPVTGKVLLGDQELGSTQATLAGSMQTSSIDANDVTASISPNGGNLMALAPSSFGEMLAIAGAGSSTGLQRLVDLAEGGSLADTQTDLQLLLSDDSGFDPLGPADMLRLYYATAYTGLYAQAYLALDDDALMDLHRHGGGQFGDFADIYYGLGNPGSLTGELPNHLVFNLSIDSFSAGG
jgi:hypothetical protein